MCRGPDGELLAWTKVLYNNRDVFGKPKQLVVGKSGTKLAIGKADAKAAGISSCILKQTGPGAGKFERTIFAFNADGEEVKLATFGIDDDGDKTVKPCSDAALASVVRLGLALKGQGAETADKVAALKRFSITLASAPAADEEEEGAGEGEEGADNEGGGDEDDA